jgi:hypothetical protein
MMVKASWQIYIDSARPQDREWMIVAAAELNSGNADNTDPLTGC